MFPGSLGYNISRLIRSALSKTMTRIGEKRLKKWEIFTAMPISDLNTKILTFTSCCHTVSNSPHLGYAYHKRRGRIVSREIPTQC